MNTELKAEVLKQLGRELRFHFKEPDRGIWLPRIKTERWVAVPLEEYKNSHQISNYGNYKRLKAKVEYDSGMTRNLPELLLKPHRTGTGYLQAILNNGDGQEYYLIHRLVATAFILNPDNLPNVNHQTGNKEDNYEDNLQWTTASNDSYHAYDSGLTKPPIRWLIRCITLNLFGLGIPDLTFKLRRKGYPVLRRCINRCISGERSHHLGLTFEAFDVNLFRDICNDQP